MVQNCTIIKAPLTGCIQICNLHGAAQRYASRVQPTHNIAQRTALGNDWTWCTIFIHSFTIINVFQTTKKVWSLVYVHKKGGRTSAASANENYWVFELSFLLTVNDYPSSTSNKGTYKDADPYKKIGCITSISAGRYRTGSRIGRTSGSRAGGRPVRLRAIGIYKGNDILTLFSLGSVVPYRRSIPFFGVVHSSNCII